MTKVAYELDAYEQEIFDAFESGTLKPLPLEKQERAKLQLMAADSLAKNRCRLAAA
jgi:hypothetical protein